MSGTVFRSHAAPSPAIPRAVNKDFAVVRARLSAEQLVARFVRAGYARVEPPVLQPADVFLDLSGEDIRRRMFVTTDAEGRELALRPEFTIPVARLHLEGPDAGRKAAYSYCGPVFRLRTGESGEFVQAGIESFGRTDLAAADAEIIGLALESVEAADGPRDAAIRLGDVGLFTALTDALGLAPAVLRRLKRAFAQGTLSPEALSDLSSPVTTTGEHAGLIAALSGQDPRAARAFVEDLLQIAGISKGVGRSPAEIAERFLSQAENEGSGLPDEARAVLARYLAIEGDLDSAALDLRELAREAGLPLDAALDLFEARTGFLAAGGVAVERIAFSTAFGRNLDYYTGMVFEIRDPRRDAKPLVGGGRYDRLMETLGAKAPVPAVGCSIWMDRLIGDAA